jgi:hypothetical protein
MGNVLPSHLRLHRRYDLKGSTYGRTAGEEELRRNPHATLKDLDVDMQVLPADALLPCLCRPPPTSECRYWSARAPPPPHTHHHALTPPPSHPTLLPRSCFCPLGSTRQHWRRWRVTWPCCSACT